MTGILSLGSGNSPDNVLIFVHLYAKKKKGDPQSSISYGGGKETDEQDAIIRQGQCDP